MAANMYRVGDYVYFENSSSNPYLIRRIEELNKTANGNVEAKVVCFYRRRDISNSLIMLADKHAKEVEEESETTIEVDLTDKQKHQLKHRELFLSRQYESLPATHIRGKCSVALLNETESVLSYLEKEDTFFYSLVYDPSLKTLLADKGEIRVGPRYQADVPDMLAEGELDDREQAKLEVKVWDPDSPLTDRQIDQFLVVARAVGTFARALDCSSSVRQPSLHMSAAAASRDITLFHAMDTLHKHNYDLSSAISVLVPLGGPVLCRDEMEEWSASEASLFEEALEKYGKDFNDIRQDFLPWKSLTSIIEYYYMWKTTDRYVQQKRLKAAEAESKLKQVYIPTYNKPNPNQISSSNGKPAAVNGAMGASYQTQASLIGRACESCYTSQSHQWYSWGPPNMQCRLCASCWIYWKKYGGLKMPTQTDEDKMSSSQPTEESHVRTHMSRQATQGTPVRNTGSPKSAVKTRQAFFLHTTCWTKLARQVCKNTLRLRQAARRPFVPINCAAIKAEYADRHCEIAGNPLKIKSTRKPLSCIIGYLEIHPAVKPNVIRSTSSLQSPSAKRLLAPSNHSSLSILGKRNYSHHNGLDESSSHTTRTIMHAAPHITHITNGKALQASASAIKTSTIPVIKRQRQNWLDASDDGFFIATEETRKIRKKFTRWQLKRASRTPCSPIIAKTKSLMNNRQARTEPRTIMH
ncbi:metastasis-associated protein MTA3 isoform X2 [Anas acuta]|uniref:Metastasis-associated protein MTA3 n=4 Tax=Anatidae TaxID=8830 RepID=A0A493STR8_ANAPP|nr:metastasis-associated protein MTA3 isoform X4 [Anas platyrhynchos]XP_032039560.1 metastasis-associated protein MTA3 isoform X1 [Aythya fuligula]|eukprot:XP_027309930.1 metastasis-associated protein MTA3 isoform X5 [Anas platyrhynchos]